MLNLDFTSYKGQTLLKNWYKTVKAHFTDVQEAVNDVDSGLSAEVTARENADNSINRSISDEVSARQTADTTLQKNISTEATARESADKVLDGKIATEATARESADKVLDGKITTEATARTNADSSLQSQINSKANASHMHKMSDITDYSAPVDSALSNSSSNPVQNKVIAAALQQAVNSEAVARASADNELGERIAAVGQGLSGADLYGFSQVQHTAVLEISYIDETDIKYVVDDNTNDSGSGTMYLQYAEKINGNNVFTVTVDDIDVAVDGNGKINVEQNDRIDYAFHCGGIGTWCVWFCYNSQTNRGYFEATRWSGNEEGEYSQGIWRFAVGKLTITTQTSDSNSSVYEAFVEFDASLGAGITGSTSGGRTYTATGTGTRTADNLTDYDNFLDAVNANTADIAAEITARENADETLETKISYKSRSATVVVASSTSKYKTDVADFVCTGTADQTVINNAIAALPSSGGKIVLMEGTYNLTGSINAVSNMTIEGMGMGSTILSTTSQTAPPIVVSGKSNVNIRDLQIVKANPATTTVTASDSSYSVTHNSETGWTINLIGNYSRGIYIISSAQNVTITGVMCKNLWAGIYSYGSNRNIAVRGCVVTGCFGGIAGQGSTTYDTHLTISDCTIYGCRTFIAFWKLAKIFIKNNVLYNSASTGIYATGSSTSNPPRNIIITDNVFYNVGEHGVNFDNYGINNFIQNNHFLAKCFGYPIRLVSSCTYNYIKDNYITASVNNSGSHYLDQGTNNTFTGNIEV